MNCIHGIPYDRCCGNQENCPMAKINKPFVRNPYNYDMNEASDETGISCPEPTLAQQQFAEESDINFIADRYGLTGEMPQVLELPRYGDFGNIFDFQQAQDAVIRAKQQFMTLPAKLRTRFDNDPQKLLTFLADDDNRAEAEFLGLVKPPQAAPQSPQGDPAAQSKGDTLSPDAKAAGKPPSKTPKTDT